MPNEFFANVEIGHTALPILAAWKFRQSKHYVSWRLEVVMRT